MEKISVVIPVYNVEKYLRRCLDSVLAQTYENLEILLIDDGAKDSSGQICDEYQQKDNRIRVIHKENGGLSSARNRGIEEATGAYIGFIDSDDYIDADMYETLYREIKRDDADVAMCDLYHCYEAGIVTKDGAEEHLQLTSEEAIAMVMEAKKTSVTAVNKLYRKKIFESVRYPIGRLSEDAFVIVELLLQAKKVAFTSKQKYYYVHRSNSITTSSFKEKDLDVIDAYEKNLRLISKHYPTLTDVAQMRYLWAHFYVLDKMMLTNTKYDKQIEKRIVGYLRKNYSFVMRDKRFNKGRKIAMLALMINVNLYKICVRANRKSYVE